MTAAPLPPDARVLVVRMGALGDIVHALPVLAAIRAARPDVAVDWLVDARYAARAGARRGGAGADRRAGRGHRRPRRRAALRRHLRHGGGGTPSAHARLRGGARPAGADQVGAVRAGLGRAAGHRLRAGATARAAGGVGLSRDRDRSTRRTRRAEEPRRAAGAGAGRARVAGVSVAARDLRRGRRRRGPAGRRRGRALRGAESGCGVAQQAVAGGALRPAGGPPWRRGRRAQHRHLGRIGATARRGGRRARGRARRPSRRPRR